MPEGVTLRERRSLLAQRWILTVDLCLAFCSKQKEVKGTKLALKTRASIYTFIGIQGIPAFGAAVQAKN